MVLGITHHQNPRSAVPAWAYETVQLWAQCRSEMGGGNLPDPGGVNDQAAWLMDAFSVCGAVEAELQAEERRNAGHG